MGDTNRSYKPLQSGSRGEDIRATPNSRTFPLEPAWVAQRLTPVKNALTELF